jgi:hypothetical protein
VSEIIIHIHEDDWGMRSLAPMEAWGEAADDLAKAEAARVANRAPDGAGFVDLHVIEAPSLTYAHVGVTRDAICAALAAHLPRVAQFNATASCGFGAGAHDAMGHYEADPDCYGLCADCFVKIDIKDGGVREVWFQKPWDAPERRDDIARLRAALLAIDALHPSFVSDYEEEAQGALGDAAFLDAYLGMRAT